MLGGIGIFLVGRAIKTEVKAPEYSVDFLTTSAPDFYTLTRQIYRWSSADFLHTFNDIFLFTLPPVVFSKTKGTRLCTICGDLSGTGLSRHSEPLRSRRRSRSKSDRPLSSRRHRCGVDVVDGCEQSFLVALSLEKKVWNLSKYVS